jgi:hypothetical protein
MIYIAHRGLINGPDADKENNPEWIREVLNMGYSVELDLRYASGKLMLGHDDGIHPVKLDFLLENRHKLWIHAKDYEALDFLSAGHGLNYFWHDIDNYTMTSYGYIWCYPGKTVPKMGICVQPEWNDGFDPTNFKPNCIGICSKYVEPISNNN